MSRERAIFGAGCFWGVEARFAELPGVLDTAAGYAGGDFRNPTYHQVCSGNTGHAEVVEVIFNPLKITYAQLLDAFFTMHNPAQPYRQTPVPGASTRNQYRSVIFVQTLEQEATAHAHIAALQSSGKFPGGVATQVLPATVFWRAEEHHQQYFAKRNIRHSSKAL